jgi:hypothetical protein
MMMMLFGHNDDDAYHLSVSYLICLQVTSLSGFLTLFAMMLTTQVRSTVRYSYDIVIMMMVMMMWN